MKKKVSALIPLTDTEFWSLTTNIWENAKSIMAGYLNIVILLQLCWLSIRNKPELYSKFTHTSVLVGNNNAKTSKVTLNVTLPFLSWGKKILIRSTVQKSWNSILRERFDFSFQSVACKSKCIYTKNKSFRLNNIAKRPLGPQFSESFLKYLIQI